MEIETQVLGEEVLGEEELNEIIHAFLNLDRSPAWERLVKTAHEQIHLREVQMHTMEIKSFEDMFSLLQLKHERAGIKLFTLLPASIVESLEEQKQELKGE